MLSADVSKAISDWTAWASKPEVQRYDIALLKIWIQFERFLGDLFISYSLGRPSEKGYVPRLKIRFHDEEQFNIFMRDRGKKYIEYLDRIETMSEHIFVDNPFAVIFSDANIKSVFEELKAIRNYIAHESRESKMKLVKQFFGGDEKKFKEPNDFLQKIRKTAGKSHYTYYTETITGLTQILVSGIVI